MQGPKFWDYLYLLRQSGSLCDIQLCVKVAGGQDSLSLPAHKLVLAASSRYFSQCLEENDFLDEYNFDGIGVEHLQSVVDYMYRQISWDALCADPIGKVVAETLQVINHDERESPSHEGLVHSPRGSGFVREVQRRQPLRYKRSYIPPDQMQTWIEASKEELPRKPRGRPPKISKLSEDEQTTVKATSEETSPIRSHDSVQTGSENGDLKSSKEGQNNSEIKNVESSECDTNSIETERIDDSLDNKKVTSPSNEQDSQMAFGDQQSDEAIKEQTHDDISIISSTDTVSLEVEQGANVSEQPENFLEKNTTNSSSDSDISMVKAEPVPMDISVCESNLSGNAVSNNGVIEDYIKHVKVENDTDIIDTGSHLQVKEASTENLSTSNREPNTCSGVTVVHTASGDKVFCIEPLKLTSLKSEGTGMKEVSKSKGSGILSTPKKTLVKSALDQPVHLEHGGKDAKSPCEKLKLETTKFVDLDESSANVKASACMNSVKTGSSIEQVVVLNPLLERRSLDSISLSPEKESAIEVKSECQKESQTKGINVESDEVISDVSEKKKLDSGKKGVYKMDNKVKEYFKKMKQMKKQGGEKKDLLVGAAVASMKTKSFDKKRAESMDLTGKVCSEGIDKKKFNKRRKKVKKSSEGMEVVGENEGLNEDITNEDGDLNEETEWESDFKIALQGEGGGNTGRGDGQQSEKDCVFCGQVFDSVQSLNDHISHAKCTNPSQSGQGIAWLSPNNSATNRSFQHTSKKHVCEKCLETFEKKKDYYDHLKQTHRELPHKCKVEQCGAEFGSYEGLHSHTQNKHSNDNPSHTCPTCGKSFRRGQQLRHHMTFTHKEAADIPCKLCGRKFKQFTALTRHLKTFHSDERNFPCPVCHRCFKTKDDMHKHERRHYQPNKRVDEFGNRIAKYPVGLDYNCTYCGKTFKNYYHKKAHESLQHLDKQAGVSYLCSLCNKSFSTRHYLNMHVNNTHRPKNIQCQACLRRFSFKYEIKRHLPKCKGYPVGPKPYECTSCGCTFTMKGNLTKHVQRGKCGSRQKQAELVTTSNADFVVVIQQDDDSSVQIPINQLTELGIAGDMRSEFVPVADNDELIHSSFVVQSEEQVDSVCGDQSTNDGLIVYESSSEVPDIPTQPESADTVGALISSTDNSTVLVTPESGQNTNIVILNQEIADNTVILQGEMTENETGLNINDVTMETHSNNT